MRIHAHAGVDHTTVAIVPERLARLREAIRNREISFPAQVPSFPRQHSAEIQWRVVALYFVSGWTCEELADRYHVTSSRIRQLLRRWVECARALGYLQDIPVESEFAVESDTATAA